MGGMERDTPCQEWNPDLQSTPRPQSLVSEVFLALHLCLDPLSERRVALSRSADDRQDDPATPWRHAGRVDHVHGFLSGGALGRLCVHARGQRLEPAAATDLAA